MKIVGITLIELIVVIAIIAIIATIALPNFTRIKVESLRSDAHTELLAVEGMIERYLVENNKPNFDNDDLALTQFEDYNSSSSTAKLSKEEYYRITITPDITGYAVTATATIDNTLTSCNNSANTDKQQCRDTLCREIFIYHTEKRSKNSLGVESNETTTKCW